MKLLTNAKLYNSELLMIKSSELIKRYNQCLETLGITPTALSKFSIDSLGWSPEIAKEKNDIFYLGAGLANPMAIILTPDQFQMPAYVPFSSYDKEALESFYKCYHYEINDITSTHAIGIDLDDSLQSYNSPADLLLINYVIIRTIIPEILEQAQEQRALVDKMTKNPIYCFDQDLREKLIESARNYGDLRYRRVLITPFQFNQITNFYTRAFGGAFVLKLGKAKNTKKIIILENPDEFENYLNNEVYFSLNNPILVRNLLELELIKFDKQYWQNNLKKLEEIITFLKLKSISNQYPDLDLTTLNHAKIKKYLIEESDLTTNILELEKIYIKLVNNKYIASNSLSETILATLCQDTNCNQNDYAIKLLLSKKGFVSPLDLFELDRVNFYNKYKTWNTNYKEYVIKKILEKKTKAL